MSTLAELPEIIGFFSYSREDDEAYKGRLSALREAIQQELGAQLGRSKATFRLWQDKAAIAPGKLWESEINNAVTQSAFFIPIVTPRMINSRYCQFEFDAFLARERVLARGDLIFPGTAARSGIRDRIARPSGLQDRIARQTRKLNLRLPQRIALHLSLGPRPAKPRQRLRRGGSVRHQPVRWARLPTWPGERSWVYRRG